MGSPSASPAEANGPAARIVSQDDQGAMVEVTCACGRKTVLRCRFPQAGGQAPAG